MDEISFTSGRDRCAAWHFGANGDAFAGPRGVPCVVMGTGIRGHSRLPPGRAPHHQSESPVNVENQQDAIRRHT